MTKHEIEILNVMRSRGKTAMDIALTLSLFSSWRSKVNQF